MNIQELEEKIKRSYEEGVNLNEAEKLAGEFLGAMISISGDLKNADLNRRMRKRGLKAIKSAIRMEEIKKHEKKPTEGYLEDVVNLNPLVADEEKAFDEYEVEKEELQRIYDVFREAHIHFRTIAKAVFNG